MREVYATKLGDAMSRNARISARQTWLRARLLVLCLLLASSSAAAQRVGAPLRQGVDHGDQRDRLTHAWPSSFAPTDSGPGVWKYVGWGALIGGVLTGGYAAYRSRDCDDCMFVGLFIGGAAGIGAVLGGLVGSFVYADRYWSDRR